MNKENQSMLLSDGRKLGFAQYGEPDGTPILYFTGGNSSRLEGRWFERIAQSKNINLIVPDRPGFGLSDFQENRRLLDWPGDVVQLANSLGVDQFSMFGLSGGAPHVAAVAHQIPERIRKAAIISGVAPPEMPDRFNGMWFPIRLIFISAKRIPMMNRFILKQMGAFYSNKEQMIKQMVRGLPLPDVQLINERPEVIDIFSQASLESHRDGIDGDAWEWKLYVHPWGFDLNDIQIEIALWYGKYDKNAPVGMGHYYAKELPNNILNIVENGGHFSTINNHIDDILSYLAQSKP